MTNKIKTKAVVFDQGNTLILDPFKKTIESQKDKLRGLFENHNITINTQEIIDEWIKSNQKINYPNIGHFLQEEPIIHDALRSLGVSSDIAAILGPELLKEYRIGLKEIIECDPRTLKVKKTLEKLKNKGKRLGVFSDDRIIGLDIVLKYMDIKQYFEYIETSESINIEKPDPRVFEHILNHFKLPENQVTYVGDNPARDIDGAKAKGLNVILYSVDINEYNEDWRDYKAKTKHKPDAVITDFSELVEIVE